MFDVTHNGQRGKLVSHSELSYYYLYYYIILYYILYYIYYIYYIILYYILYYIIYIIISFDFDCRGVRTCSPELKKRKRSERIDKRGRLFDTTKKDC